MWIPTLDEAAEMYARYWSARFGRTAKKSAEEMAELLAAKGDLDGKAAWQKVAVAIERFQQNKTGPIRH